MIAPIHDGWPAGLTWVAGYALYWSPVAILARLVVAKSESICYYLSDHS